MTPAHSSAAALALSEPPPADPALAILGSVFGYPSFRSQQAEIIAHMIAGGDAPVPMPTGAGESLCVQVPALLRPGVAPRFGQSPHL